MTDSEDLLPDAPAAGELRLVRCRECRRPLRDPESRALRVGRECEEQVFAARGFDADQDVLPGL
ncbi:DUF6011 domain-containing protein [Streptacidiphilus sp. N1-3]|uniref:DUF6011 domain-containing protein n=1 Tax=Streptacidiphilus alkalitolerans TaxID=3342712 RepID=A0ABV6X8L6_9ACTN